MAVTRDAFEQARASPVMMEHLIAFSAMEGAQQLVDKWLQETGLYHKVRIGVVAVWDDFLSMQLNAWAKVIVVSSGSFEHEEPYVDFPSDHFKTKVLLATGGA